MEILIVLYSMCREVTHGDSEKFKLDLTVDHSACNLKYIT